MFSYVTCSQKSSHCSHLNVFLCYLFPNVFALFPSKCFLMFPVPECLCTVALKMFSYVPCSQMSLHCSPQNVFLCSLFPNVLALFPQNIFFQGNSAKTFGNREHKKTFCNKTKLWPFFTSPEIKCPCFSVPQNPMEGLTSVRTLV